VLCHRTETNARTHALIRANLGRSPMYSGEIRGTGPRYCPSIEDKVVKFPERESHHIFLEPEGREAIEIYVNGISTSMPEEVQLEFVQSMRGLGRAEMLRPGYAVEYDFVLPHQLQPTLELKSVPGLFLAGQICGTSGYEEAAAQGFVAGVNAALTVRGEDPLVLRRDQAYIGVLVDDLVTREHREPYRMFTSAAEHRLLLRADNADERLTEIGFSLGLVTREQMDRARAKRDAIDDEERRLSRVTVKVPDLGAPAGAEGRTPLRGISGIEFLARPESRYEDLAAHALDTPLPAPWADCLTVRVRYRGYIERQHRAAERSAALERWRLPDALWADALSGMSTEAREKLQRWRPATVAQASRIAGVSPADVAVLLVHARRVAGVGAASDA